MATSLEPPDLNQQISQVSLSSVDSYDLLLETDIGEKIITTCMFILIICKFINTFFGYYNNNIQCYQIHMVPNPYAWKYNYYPVLVTYIYLCIS